MFLQWFRGRSNAQAALAAPSHAPRMMANTAAIAAADAATPVALMATPHALAPALDDAALGHLFHAWLHGKTAADPRAAAQHKVLLDALQRLAASPGAGAHLVPRVPAIIPQLLRSLRDEHMSGADVSRLLAQDVVLVAQVIRAANSPFYSPRAPIQTIESAILLLGQNGMRALLAQVAFRPVISTQTGKLARVAAPQAWRHAELCAQAATLLAPRLRANPFEAYLAGLMQNVGLIVAFRLFDQIDPDLVLPRSEPFDAAVAVHARALSARIAALWELPPSVVEALSGASDPEASALARTLVLADHVAKLRVLVDAGVLNATDPATLAGMDDAALACFARLAAPDA
ncbi:HDOD domain-containing protein [Massilia sp. CF038]|uniref:HDOD domain-containing protein n=1 Tax=Massilia sp. CF038 TaxID=1881045 RepID=UPI00091783FC|nr:HDOD domain-containing protein [Massilia sp. CF038]SHG97385.1 HD-like signal output (HDOD) domain, no enzymatic activity [Massilia sp. CF038]